MKSGIIISEAGMGRHPWLAFTLSFFLTGLGQVYNGDLAKGIAFFMLRVFTFIFPVAVIIFKNYDSYLSFFAAAAGLNVLIWLLSSVEAVFTARGLDVINLKKYNSLIFYIVYGVINISILLSSYFLCSLFISIEKVSNDDMNPSFFSDEYILVNKYSINNLDIGDVVIYSNIESVNTGRIIAKAGEEYRYEGGKFYINDAALPLGILSAEEMDYLGLDSFEELFYETNGKRRYPVKVFFENNIEPDGKMKNAATRNMNSVQINKDMLLISSDNRTSYKPDSVIAGESVKGRVEGVFFTFNFGRLFLKPCLND